MDAPPPATADDRPRPRVPVRLWHLVVLVAFAAVAFADIRDQRIREPVLVVLAAGGLVLYALLAWLAWRVAVRAGARRDARWPLLLYPVAMAALFYVATVLYLLLERAYRFGL